MDGGVTPYYRLDITVASISTLLTVLERRFYISQHIGVSGSLIVLPDNIK
jgi:hypothetical protein